MPNIMTALKAEIVRLARKEIKGLADPIRKSATANRLALADLKRRVAALEKQVAQLPGPARAPAAAREAKPAKSKGWISGKGVRSLRLRLNLSQDAFAKLVGVTPNGVYQWERKDGMLRLRDRTRDAVLAARSLNARTAKQRLSELA